MAAVSIAPSPPHFENQFVEQVWEAFKPYALTLRDIIMHNIQSPQEPPEPSGSSPSTPLKLPSIQTRRAACTHLTMGRLNGKYECMICHKPSELGWVYSCTQDDEQCTLPDAGESIATGQCDEDVRLNPWVEKAIKEGQYAPKQVAILRAQKQKVMATIAAAEEEFKHAPQEDPNSNQAQQSATTPSVDANPHLPYAIITEMEHIPTANGSKEKLKVFPHCKFRSCHACRPTNRDRAWQVLEPIFAVDFLTSMRFSEESCRRVSDAKIVRKMGFKEPRPTRPPLRSLDSIGLYSSTPTGHIVHASTMPKRSADVMRSSIPTNTVDVSDVQTEPDSRGFRDSIKRALRGMLSSSRRASTQSRSNTRPRCKAMFSEEEEDGAEFDMGLWRHLNDELLNDASGVPLPGHDGMDGLSHEEGEIEVKDGVAVTEEGVDLGTADIIMSI